MAGGGRRPAGKSQALYEQLRDDLVAGSYAPGSRLSEHEVGVRYAVSRTPVRDALARLAHEGLLQRAGGIVVVPAPTVEQILDLFDARITVESSLAAYAARRRHEADVVVLRAAAQQAREMRANAGRTQLSLSNSAFHHALSEAAHNDVLADVQRQLDLRVAGLRSTTLTAPGRWQLANDQHDEIVAAVVAGDADAAAAAATRHLSDARGLWLDLVHEQRSSPVADEAV